VGREAEEEEMRGMRSNASHIFIISPENVTIREEVVITLLLKLFVLCNQAKGRAIDPSEVWEKKKTIQTLSLCVTTAYCYNKM
jgi:hypothetical protein